MSPVWNRRQHPIVIAHPHSPTVPEYVPPTLFNRSVRRVQRWYFSLAYHDADQFSTGSSCTCVYNKLTVMMEYVP